MKSKPDSKQTSMINPRKREWFDDDAFWKELAPFLCAEKAFAEAVAQVDNLLRLSHPRGKAVLDLCCGPGRWAIALARRGYQVTGVDRTKFYLDKARTKARSARVRVEWIQADMRDFLRPQAYDLVLSMWTSLGYFDDKREDLRVLENVFRNLRPGGVCLLDLMGKEILARTGQPTTSEILSDGTRWVMRHEIFDDWTRVRNEWMFIRNGRVRTHRFHHTIHSGQELRQLLEQVGFVDVQLYGGLDGTDYGLDAKRLIAVARKPGSIRVRAARQVTAKTDQSSP